MEFFSWLPHLLAMCASLLCLAALVLILRVYDGHEIFLWHRITLNTIVSLLTTTSKIGLLFVLSESTSQWVWILFGSPRSAAHLVAIDRGSRGPLGSLQLIWSIDKATILRCGALATILAVAIDPFAQQLVQLSQHTVYHSSPNATIPRAQRYSKGHDLRDLYRSYTYMNLSAERHYSIMKSTIDYSLQSAVVSALTRPAGSVTQQLPFACSSGNCTWEPFESLAVCSVCHDLKEELSRFKHSGKLAYWLTMNDVPSPSFTGRGTAFGLPNGHFISNVDGWAFDHSFNETVAGSATGGVVQMSTFGTPYASWTSSFTGMPNLIWAMSMIKVLPNWKNPSEAWPNLPIEAKECALTYCVNEYRSSVVNGTLFETVLSNLTTRQRDPGSWQVDTSGYGTMDSITADSLAFNSFYSWFRRTDLMLGDDFNISQPSINSISSFFQNNFAADLSAHDYYINYTWSDGYPMLNGFYMNNGDAQWQPGVMEALYSSRDLNETFSTIAQSMSNAIREGSDGAVTSSGESGTQVIYYDIQWPWISLHCFVALIGLIFLILTMMRSKKVGTPMYGSSIPAVIPEEGLVDAVQAMYIKDNMLTLPSHNIAVAGRTHHNPHADGSVTELHDLDPAVLPRPRLRDRDSAEDGLLQGPLM